jgi:hypothetical protein
VGKSLYQLWKKEQKEGRHIIFYDYQNVIAYLNTILVADVREQLIRDFIDSQAGQD